MNEPTAQPSHSHRLPMSPVAALAFSRWCQEKGIKGVSADRACCQILGMLPSSTYQQFEAEYPSEAAQRGHLRQFLHGQLGKGAP